MSRHGPAAAAGVEVVGTSVAAAAAVVTLVEVTSAALAVPVLAAEDFVQPRIGTGALILPVEVLADTTTEAAARLLLGHTNSADGETNR